MGLACYNCQQQIAGASVTEQLKALLRIEDGEERKVNALTWWQGLSETDRAQVVDLVQSASAAWQTVWMATADYLGQLAKQILDTWSKVVEESPELQAYMAALEAKGEEDSVRAFLAKNAADVRLETTRLEGVADGDGLLHWVPPDAYRVTACDQVTPITNLKMDGRSIAEDRDLCPVCWSEMEDAWWSDEYEEWFTGDEEEE
jgi:hypothetical protein